MKEMGVGLGIAVLLDATLVRGVALPAVVALLGERGVRAPRRLTGPAGGWDDARRTPIAASGTNAR
jgi:RND superfamily putative drug exporter